MTLRQVHRLYLVAVIAVPVVVSAVVWRSEGITAGVFVMMLGLSVSPGDILFRWMLRRLGDRSEGTVRNAAVRFGLGVPAWKDVAPPLRQVYPHLNAEEIQQLVSLHHAVNERLAFLAREVNEGRTTKRAARDALRAEFPFLDEDNLAWLNARGRAHLLRRARR